MNVKEVAKSLGLETLSSGTDQEVLDGYASDMLSDVIANAPEGGLWITVQRHMNILAVAQLRKVAGIVVSGGLDPEPALVEKARQEGIPLFKSRDNSFILSGKLFALIRS